MKVNFECSNVNAKLISFSGKDSLPILIGESTRVLLKDVIMFPGLTNAHDHLEFNLFPFLGNRIYNGYKEWAVDIHQNNKSDIERVLKVPFHLRFKWGVIKNLLSGVTTIVHHGRLNKAVRSLIRSLNYPVYTNYQYLHALDTEPFWKIKLNLPLRKDLMVHIGEGATKEAKDEVERILRWNFIRRKIIGIHGIGMNEEQSKFFRSVIWCPDSNLRLYGETARVDLFKKHTKVLFGTDSALSASSNIWVQLRIARSLSLLSDVEIFESLTSTPALVLRPSSERGIIVAKKKLEAPWDSFFAIDPEDLVVVSVDGQVVLADRSVAEFPVTDYGLIKIGKSVKWIQKRWVNVIDELEAMGFSLPLETRSINRR